MASRGGYLGGSTIIRVHHKQSKTSKIKQMRKQERNAKLAVEWAAYKANLELPVQSVGPSRVMPSKAGKRKATRILKELEPIITQLRQLARDFTRITSEPSSLVHDLAIYEVQSMENIVGVRRGLAGFDGWRKEKRVCAVGGLVPQSSTGAMGTPIAIEGLDQEWDELSFVLFDDLYNTHSIYRVSKSELCDFIGELGWIKGAPAFVLPLSVLVNLSDHVSGKKLDYLNVKTIVEGREGGGKKGIRYFRST